MTKNILLSGLYIHFLHPTQWMKKICQENSNQKEAGAEKWALGNKKIVRREGSHYGVMTYLRVKVIQEF